MEDDLFDASLNKELRTLIAREHGHVQLLHMSGFSQSHGFCKWLHRKIWLCRFDTGEEPLNIQV